MLVNVVDVPPLCNFIMPAIARSGPISIAVSTRGASPALAKRLRSEIAEAYGEPYAQLAEMLNDIRGWARETLATYQDRKVFFEAIVNGEPDPIELLRKGDAQAVRDAHRRARARGRQRRCPCLRRPAAPGSPPSSSAVAERSYGSAFCMFRDADPALECAEGPAIRRANVAAYLDARAGRAPLLLIGEAMGYAGGRFTGIAFTAERTLQGLGSALRGDERTAGRLGRAVGHDRPRRARSARARGRDGALERRAGASAPPGRAALQPHARRSASCAPGPRCWAR